MNNDETVKKLMDKALNICGDHEAQHDITTWSLSVKKPNKGQYYIRGNFVNHFLDKAFGKEEKEREAAIEAVKQQLWFAFREGYLEKIGEAT